MKYLCMLGTLGIIPSLLLICTGRSKIGVAALIMSILLTIPWIAAAPKNSSSTHYEDDTGYWGADGYYNPSESERQKAIHEAEDWIRSN